MSAIKLRVSISSILNDFSCHGLTEIEATDKILLLFKKQDKQLLDFFLWFRANGEGHIDKSIEEMIAIYEKSI